MTRPGIRARRPISAPVVDKAAAIGHLTIDEMADLIRGALLKSSNMATRRSQTFASVWKFANCWAWAGLNLITASPPQWQIGSKYHRENWHAGRADAIVAASVATPANWDHHHCIVRVTASTVVQPTSNGRKPARCARSRSVASQRPGLGRSATAPLSYGNWANRGDDRHEDPRTCCWQAMMGSK